jgi:hypothetical protein
MIARVEMATAALRASKASNEFTRRLLSIADGVAICIKDR